MGAILIRLGRHLANAICVWKSKFDSKKDFGSVISLGWFEWILFLAKHFSSWKFWSSIDDNHHLKENENKQSFRVSVKSMNFKLGGFDLELSTCTFSLKSNLLGCCFKCEELVFAVDRFLVWNFTETWFQPFSSSSGTVRPRVWFEHCKLTGACFLILALGKQRILCRGS